MHCNDPIDLKGLLAGISMAGQMVEGKESETGTRIGTGTGTGIEIGTESGTGLTEKRVRETDARIPTGEQFVMPCAKAFPAAAATVCDNDGLW